MKLHPLLLLLPVLAGGCEELEPFLPTVRFNTLTVDSIDFQQAQVDFVFDVANPNPVEVPLSSFSYDFALGGASLFDGDNADGFTLEASDSSELRLPVNLVWAETWEAVQATRGQDVIGFGLGGHFGFDTPAGEARIPYDEDGDFPALRTPKFNLRNLRVTNLNLTGASLALDVGIDNEHASSLFFDRFDYGVSLNGQSLASGLINTFEVDGATEGGLVLPINVNFLSAGAGLVSAITSGGPVQVDLGASMDVQTPFGTVPLSIQEVNPLDLL